MKLHYMGKYNLDPESLPGGEHQPDAVMFKEFKDSKRLALFANALAIIILAILMAPFFTNIIRNSGMQELFACIASMLILFPHEILHALCFKEDVFLYTNLKQGMLFVMGPETMTKSRFVFMSLLPNIVFGIIPYVLGIFFPEYPFLLVFGAICTGMGAGDYYNVFNALAQMPKGARTYMHGFNSFWYMPEQK